MKGRQYTDQNVGLLKANTLYLFVSFDIKLSFIPQMLHPKYYRVGIRIWTRQEGIGNSSHGLRTAYRDWATDSIAAQLGSTDSVAPGNPWAKYWY